MPSVYAGTNQSGKKTLVVPPPPGTRRIWDLAVDKSGLTTAPANATVVGTSYTPLKLDPFMYKGIHLDVTLTLTPGGTAKALVLSEQEQASFIRQVRFRKNSSDQYYTVQGQHILLLHRLAQLTRPNENLNNCQFLQSVTANAQTIKLNFFIPFFDPLLEPRDLNLITGYGDANNSWVMEIDFGNANDFISGDTSALITGFTFVARGVGYDYRNWDTGMQMMNEIAKGDLQLPRFQPFYITRQTSGTSTVPGDSFEMIKTLVVSGVLVFDQSAAQPATPNYNITQGQIQFNTDDFPFGQRLSAELQNDGNYVTKNQLFNSSASTGGFDNVIPFIFADRRDYRQLVETLVHRGSLVDKFYVNLVNGTSGKNFTILVLQQNIPAGAAAYIAPKVT